ncbi:MAG: DUF5309 domain-containing protein [Archaeoglobaceae archaeon]
MPVLTYNVVGRREDLSDIITNITPEDTPIYSTIGSTKATNTYHEWLEDTLNLPNGAPAGVLEGAEYTEDTPTVRVRKGNYTQIFRRVYKVSGTQEAVVTAGVKSELKYQLAKALKEVAIEVERAIILNATANAGSSTTPRTMGGIPAFVTTNVLANGGVVRPLTEDLLNQAIMKAWEKGGSPKIVVCAGNQKRVISTFSSNVTKFVEAEKGVLPTSIDVYDSDFGRVRVIAHRQGMPNNKVYVLDTDLWKVAYLRPFRRERIPETGDWVGGVVIGELTLEARAEQGNAIIADLIP